MKFVKLDYDKAQSVVAEHKLQTPNGQIRSRRNEIAQLLERGLTDRKVRSSNPTSTSRLPLSMLEQPGSISVLVLPSSGMATVERFSTILIT
ncbi:hypothetical protein CSKR_104965 [Clonorchis sinensis]|uniref:Uncharacterized protein n=1 Tax=Clonorchis sinensis TaxID=79923 RepID=A0A419Q6Q2_CLOSI|nr:hypothetical protein CSKR_104965 [Clonorchis sinensis]